MSGDLDVGEGDRTLASWREAHRKYFGRLGQLPKTCSCGASVFGLLNNSRKPTDTCFTSERSADISMCDAPET